MRFFHFPETIRGKIRVLFAISLISVSFLTLGSVWSLFVVRNRLLLSESYNDLLNSMLEVRRLEKNMIFGLDTQSLANQIFYLGKIEQLTNELADDILSFSSSRDFEIFQHSFMVYSNLARQFHTQSIDSSDPHTGLILIEGEEIRSIGREMLEYLQELLRAKRSRIHSAILWTSILPFAFLVVFIFVFTLINKLLIKRMLIPLNVVSEATRRLARGDFSPVSCDNMEKDEIRGMLCELNQMAEELEANQEDLVQARKMAALGTFTAGIAHELNNPLNNISLTAQAFIENYGEDLDTEAQEYLSDIVSQAERAADIVKDLLDFSRMEESTFTTLNIKDVIEDTLDLIKNQLMVKRVRISTDLEPGLPEIEGNIRNLEQVFMNLILNAVHAMPGGGAISLNAYHTESGFICVDIHDTGKGISPEHLPHIFEPFFTTKSVGLGTGLGLAVTYSLIKRHKGRIEVSSEPGLGTTFSVYLPVREEQGDS